MNNILLCVSGLTPQIVTETLFCLSVQKNIAIDEVYIITTIRGSQVILGNDTNGYLQGKKLVDELLEMCINYNIKPPKFKANKNHVIVAQEESTKLHDIRSDKHNKLFPNKVAEFLKEKTADPNNSLFCSISGGRKSMSVHLANVLSIFGRANDKLFHILTSEEFEFKNFYPKTKKEAEKLILAEIPYVRLRSLISPYLSQKNILNKKYSDLVDYTQKKLVQLTSYQNLLIDIPNRKLHFNGNYIMMEPLELALYFYIVEESLNNKEPLSIHKIVSVKFAQKVKNFLDEYIPTYHYNDSVKNPWWKKGFDDTAFRSKRSKINKKISNLIPDKNIAEIFKINSNKLYGETSYNVISSKIKIRFDKNL